MMEPDDVDLLLVEDDPDDAAFVERLLTEFGAASDRLVEVDRIVRADRLATALELLEEEPDVILLDLGLPDSDGLESIEALTERAPRVPVVVITGRTERHLGPEAIARGAQDYLRKGRITGEVLHRTLRYAIDRHRTQREIVELNRRLSLVNRRLSVLHRIVRQDIRADLHMVVGRGDELRDRVDEATEPIVSSLLAAARHAVELTDTAGEVLGVLATEDELELEPVDLGAIVDEQVALVGDARDVDVAVRREVGGERLTVEATPVLGSAIGQLLSNAVRHTDRERPRVTVTLETTDREAVLAIADDGVGMPETQRALLNDPETRYDERSGIGTGLYHAMTVLERCGGEIEFADRYPRGTEVTVRLAKADSD